jgi:diadenosine tetraphosphatase ApaH/serine/threonine PP2A family protein phosphatase
MPIVPVYRQAIQLDNGNRQIINPGSIGQPRDNDPRAAYAILDVEKNVWEFRRIDYPIQEVQARMRAIDMPDRLIKRLEHGW